MKSCGHSLIVEPPGTTGEVEGRNLLAVPIPRSEAAPFILEHHYTHIVPTGPNIYFGCYVEGVLYAVANFGSLASRTPVAHIVGKADATEKNTVELKRLCRLGEKGERGPVKTPKFLRACHKLLKPMGIRYILSYSDRKYNSFAVQRPEVEHQSGGVYLFSGYKWLGATGEEWHVVDKNGKQEHRAKAYKRMLAHNVKVCGGDDKIPRKATGNRDRIWPEDLPRATSVSLVDDTLRAVPEKSLVTLDQVRRAMGFKRVRCPPKDKWLLEI